SKAHLLMPVHLFGQCAPMEELLKLANDHGMLVVEDNAQALGSVYTFSNQEKKFSGTMGNLGCTSFFPSKNLGAFGDGGAMFTNDEHLALKARSIANHGQSVKYKHDEIGVNSRLDTLQAAILNVKLKNLKDFNSRRQQVAAVYDSELGDFVVVPKRETYSSHVFHQYTVKLESNKTREALKEHLNQKGIPSMVYYPIPLHLQPGYSFLGYSKGDFPVAEKLSETVLSLPIHTEMEEDQLSYIVEEIKTFFRS
ncbi:MAG: DegT/DnrJ/EryC1/StrS family aminotransferase, partial [Cytophagales bacterium]